MKIEWGNITRTLIIVGAITLVGNLIRPKINPIEALPGMLLLILIVLIGLALTAIVPFKLPSIAFISLVGIVLTYPGVPFSDVINKAIAKVDFLALTTPVLAYAGIAVGKDIGAFAKLGWKIIVVSLLVFTGTYLGSAVVAHVILSLTGQI